MQPILGILGGMGPLATLDFIRNIYKSTPDVRVDSDHIRIISDINVKIPSRTRSVLLGEESPSAQMIKSIEGLAAIGASYVAVPCNSAHYFYNEVSPQLPIKWINMLETVSDRVRQLGGSNVLILGGYVTVTKKIYDQHLDQTCYLKPDENEAVYRLIEDLKLSKGNYEKSVMEIIQYCKNKKVDTVVLACTELTEVIDLFEGNDLIIVDSNLVYAESLIELVLQSNV